MLLILVSILTLIYSALLFYFILGAQRLYKKHSLPDSKNLPYITVVVPLRNEENSALETLEALAAQDYSGKWEVICVNDRSTDNTKEIIDTFCQNHANFSVLSIGQDEPEVPSPKKRALTLGFSHAKGDILMTTDADCIPPACWLTSMAGNFTESIGIVQGPKKIIGDDSILTRYQQLETFGFVSIEATTFAMGRPMLASAPSLAYYKSLFNEAGGFSGIEHLVSGDDDMMVHKMTRLPGGNVRYNLDPKACVVTKPAATWREMLSQRARWASNGAKYTDKKFVALLFAVFLFYLWLLLSPVFFALNLISWPTLAFPYIAKFVFDYFFLFQTAGKFNETKLLNTFWWAELINIPVVAFSVIAGHAGLFRWKK